MPITAKANNRRDNPRVSIKVPVKFVPAEDKKALKKIKDWRESREYGVTLDLSTDGMQLSADHHLTVGSVLEFNIYILDKVNPCKGFLTRCLTGMNRLPANDHMD